MNVSSSVDELPPGFRLEPTTHANVGDVRPLYRRLFGRAPTLEVLRAKYAAPLRPRDEFLGCLARDVDGNVVGHYGATLHRFHAEGRLVLVGQGCDVMALPGRRYKGVFDVLSRTTDRRLADAGAEFCIGFANAASRAALVKRLGWREPHTLRGFAIPVLALPLEAIARHARLNRMWLAWARLCLARYAAADPWLPGSVPDHEGGGAVRDAAHYAYRQFSVNRVIEVHGVRVWVKVDRGLVIGELERVDEARVLEAVDGLRRVARLLGLRQILFHGSPGAWHTSIFERHFSGFDSWTVVSRQYSDATIDIGRLCFTAGDVDTF